MTTLQPAMDAAPADDFKGYVGDPDIVAPTIKVRRRRRFNSDPILHVAVGMLLVTSVAFFVTVLRISHADPTYFDRLLTADLTEPLDPMITGTATKGDDDGALPVPVVTRAQEPKPSDFQIVMVFDGEALLATGEELFRVKVGSVLPGLGTVLEIHQKGDGGTIVTSNATLSGAGA
ncbi:hypothetical protein [Mangrovicella endophytica]|uniref:hypothetical protein n=1 Tax=Mangrovicella endophytica TaxID=2066697 RepID=UPI000C9E1897|nr:hypothetical protein [Mangrovicella endophytica]